jgi:hypothetical protein
MWLADSISGSARKRKPYLRISPKIKSGGPIPNFQFQISNFKRKKHGGVRSAGIARLRTRIFLTAGAEPRAPRGPGSRIDKAYDKALRQAQGKPFDRLRAGFPEAQFQISNFKFPTKKRLAFAKRFFFVTSH